MQTHPRLAHGEFSTPQGRLTENRQWEELRAMLSEHGPDKSIDQWKVTRRDLRRKTRTDGRLARRAANSTGNATVVPVLTDQTKKKLGIMGTEGAFVIKGGEESGIRSTPAALFGIPTPVEEVEVSFDENESFTQLDDNTLNETAQDTSQQRGRPIITTEQQRPQLPQQNQRDVANQLAIANRYSAIRSRFTYKEK